VRQSCSTARQFRANLGSPDHPSGEDSSASRAGTGFAAPHIAPLLVEQYLEFAREVADDLIVMDRGEVVVAGAKSEVDEGVVKRYLTV
jgi:hypothetical protein